MVISKPIDERIGWDASLTGINFLHKSFISLFTLALFMSTAVAQDLDPRAYSRVPVDASTLISGFSFSHGGVLTDASLQIEDLKAKVQTASMGYARVFNFFGMQSQALVMVPYSFAQASATVAGQSESISRSGFSDLRLRLSVLFHGAPSATVQELRKAPRKTILGASLSIVVPTGQFFPDRLVNLGTNRWAFRPELAISHPFAKRWMIDFYSGLWLFTNNNSFYPGNSIRSQKPMGTFQAHLSYNIKLTMWLAFDATYYAGGETTINMQPKKDQQSNSRYGATFVFPTGKLSSIKLAASTGAIIRLGPDFTTYSIGWQRTWPGKKSFSK